MDRAVRDYRRTVPVLSPDYLRSDWCRVEWTASYRKGLLPVRVRECQPDGLLGPIDYCDLVGLNEDQARERLRQSAHGGGRPDKPPAFPAAPKPRFPGALPEIWNLTHDSNPHFTGRGDVLDRIAGPRVAITGPGGIGKTQIAVEYTYRNVAAYSVGRASASAPGCTWKTMREHRPKGCSCDLAGGQWCILPGATLGENLCIQRQHPTGPPIRCCLLYGDRLYCRKIPLTTRYVRFTTA